MTMHTVSLAVIYLYIRRGEWGMKKTIRSLLLPTVIVVGLIVIMSAAYVADSLKTGINAGKAASVFLPSDYNDGKINFVIDAGHGGADGGAVSVTGNVESKINLDIALKTDCLAAFFGTNTVMTRSDEEIDYPEEANTIRAKKIYDQKSRVSLINDVPNAVLISIHQNNFTQRSAHGANVFYRNSSEGLSLANSIMENLSKNVSGTENRAPKIISNDIYLFKNINCPAVLIECGFLSNPEENALLDTDTYRTKLAILITSGFLSCEKELASSICGGTNENENSVLLY